MIARLTRGRASTHSLDPDAPGMTPHSRSSLHIAVAAAVLVALIGGTVWFGAYLGVLPWRGPLEQGAQTGWNRLAFQTRVGNDAAYISLSIPNPSRVDVTIDSVTPSDSLPHVQVVTAWIPRPATPCAKAAAGAASAVSAPSGCRVSVQGYVLPASTVAGAVPRLVVVLKADTPGRYVTKGFDIHYHVGPVSYTTTIASGFVMTVSAA